MQISAARRPLVAKTPAKVASAKAAAAVQPAAVKKPAAPALAVKAQQTEGKVRKHEAIMGAVGGAAAGLGVSLLLGMVAAMGAPLGALVVLAPIPALAAVGAGVGYAWGTIEEKLLGKWFKSGESQYGAWIASGSVMSNAGTIAKGAAKAGAISGVGNLLFGGWQAAKEHQLLKAEKAAGGEQLTDNKLRLGGAIAATAGGGLALAALIPAAAGLAPVLVPVGAGVALLGWGANLLGQFKNEAR